MSKSVPLVSEKMQSPSRKLERKFNYDSSIPQCGSTHFRFALKRCATHLLLLANQPLQLAPQRHLPRILSPFAHRRSNSILLRDSCCVLRDHFQEFAVKPPGRRDILLLSMRRLRSQQPGRRGRRAKPCVKGLSKHAIGLTRIAGKLPLSSHFHARQSIVVWDQGLNEEIVKDLT
jgi:hypothetical protein